MKKTRKLDVQPNNNRCSNSFDDARYVFLTLYNSHRTKLPYVHIHPSVSKLPARTALRPLVRGLQDNLYSFSVRDFFNIISSSSKSN